ncbi:PEP-CTERM sorting domain-containing protein [Thalassoglobus sp. JC818]|uniref:PEP-CTERM sorting domain-containing protein n=1 Tax=Thalassoglobus sp. JC818 TaxID=3232136 RepID=UPI00345A7C2F
MPQSLTVKTVAIFTLLVMTAGFAQAGLVDVGGGSYIQASLRDGSSEAFLSDSGPLNFGPSKSHNISTAGISSTVNVGSIAAQGNFVLNLTTNQVRTGMVADGAYMQFGLFFTPTVNVSYAASGFYTASLGSGNSSLLFYLFDTTDHSPLFQSALGSTGLASPYYTLGGMEGEFPYFEGSLTGTLIAGREYFLYGGMFMQASNGGDNGDTANGAFRFVVSHPKYNKLPTNAIPEPTSFALFGIGSIGLLLRRRRQRA